jgi:hypothetical protein
MEGNWYGTDDQPVTSARSAKTDIESLADKHSVLFDNLVPRSFKYAHGKSGRLHYGLVLDELKDAMDAAGLSEEECAAYCLIDPDDPDGMGGIRYSELIALCIREIQLLKQQIQNNT